MSSHHCPSCASKSVPYVGHSDILIIGEFPGQAELESGRPFSTHRRFTTAGFVLRREFASVGLDLNQFRVGNLWLHEPNDNENCRRVGYELALEEAKGKAAIMLVGSDAVSTFTKYKVSDVCGLQVDSSILSAPIIYAMTNPAIVLHGRGLGEVRLACRKWAARLEDEGLI